MRFLGVGLLFLSLHVQAEECGLYQVEDFGDRVVISLIDFNSLTPARVNFNVVNQLKSMIPGLCYCVEGAVTQDPNYVNDPNYKILNIQRILTGPYNGCGPSI